MAENNVEPGPSEETLRVALQLEWQDHIQTRAQTWQSLPIVAALLVGLIGIDWQIGRRVPTTTGWIASSAAPSRRRCKVLRWSVRRALGGGNGRW